MINFVVKRYTEINSSQSIDSSQQARPDQRDPSVRCPQCNIGNAAFKCAVKDAAKQNKQEAIVIPSVLGGLCFYLL